ncbi:hypothetical protein RhiirB3_533623, partial [Rhizophagus irregularis]
SGKAVSHLKEAIKAKKHKTFHGVEADELRLWKVEIGGDHLDDPLKNLILNDNNELSAINEIGDYWSEKPPRKHIHVLVEPPQSTATSSREQELLDELTTLRALLNNVRCCRESETNEELQVDREYRTRNPRWPQRTHTWSAQDTSTRE